MWSGSLRDTPDDEELRSGGRHTRRALSPAPAAEHGIGFACARALAVSGMALVLTSTTDRIHARAAQIKADRGRAVALAGGLTSAGTATSLVRLVLCL